MSNNRLSFTDSSLAEMIMASSVATIIPMTQLIIHLGQRGVIDISEFKGELEKILITDSFPPQTRAFLKPVWEKLKSELK